ncbi:SRPBCC domain-containing protein [Paraburkholderia bryophila]|uniref:SRPBCC family protein n=1 Tax=Paraburkholderia bryophila TaxID=420952 RepID=UPI00234B9896|nr:SRPBCC domain-containing protein [Paraburkholderia bryophila]WCM22094.1 SRPBCC domain-containing protein [Paraburkholderia bryophila]
MSGQTVRVRRLLPASCDEVFDAWLDPDGMREWMLPGTVKHCEVMLEPRVGGRFHIFMSSARAEYVHTGEYRVLERPSKLVFTWVSSRMDQQETLVTVELFARGEQCEIVLTHERVPVDHAGKGLAVGWNQMLVKLGASFTKQGASGGLA